eukprot:Opistho-2@89950
MNNKAGEGLTDFVMLNDVTEESFMKNLKERFEAGHIYTYIGEQVVSVNPFRKVDIYTPKIMESYKRMYMYEVPPHIYALADDTYRALMQTKDNQCVIITGESGAGKTEASKIFMQYIAKVSANRGEGDNVKGKLLDSNPVLEAFGNSKTLRNDNSSRFGKYMEINFDGAGAPVGGKVSQYLLEKSRVVTRAEGERSFHVFYQLLSQKDKLSSLGLQADPSKYAYLASSKCNTVDSINDSEDFKEVTKAMKSLGWSDLETQSVWRVLAAVLLVGNVDFVKDASKQNVDAVNVSTKDIVKSIADLLECDSRALENALVTRSISTGAGKSHEGNINVFLDKTQAIFTRDSLAKSLYDQLFTWVVGKINEKIVVSGRAELVIGVLDIYGFEIFEHNSFEQFCINFCNEKLQQLFIKLVLKQEQEEYVRENIEWEEIKYFNNAPICELFENTPIGIYSLLDEACMVGQSTPESFLEKLNGAFSKHAHFETFTKDKTLGKDKFRIKHYAGVVTYEAEHFLFKNRDSLFHDLIVAMQSSKNALVTAMFPQQKQRDMKRPLTAGTQFKQAVQELVTTLNACQPHYIRCIKSNDVKRGQYLDEERVKHQVRYLNLVETVRVRRAGFCNRQPYERCLPRYKMLSKKTWPVWRGSNMDGIKAILDELKVDPKEYRLGKTKLFIRNAKTLFLFEERRAIELPKVVIAIQRRWKGHKTRKWFKQALEQMRAERAELEAKLRRVRAVNKIQVAYVNSRARKYIAALNRTFSGVQNARPHFGKGTPFPTLRRGKSSPIEAYVAKIHLVWWGRAKVLSLSEEERALMRQKIVALDLFRGNKPWACARRFKGDYLGMESNNARRQQFHDAVQHLFQKYGDSEIQYADDVVKVNPKGKPQLRTIIMTEQNIYKYDPKKYKIKKVGIPLQSVQGVALSRQRDGYIVIHMAAPERDIVIDCGVSGEERVSELATVIFTTMQRNYNRQIPVRFEDRVVYNNSRDAKGSAGSDVSLTFAPNPKPQGNESAFKLLKKDQAVVHFTA